jgi:hypothetical protein
MTGGPNLDLERDIAALKEATREAHEAIRDARQVKKELEDALREIPKRISDLVADLITTSTETQLAGYNDIIQQAIEAATDAVTHRFQTIADILLGEDKKTRKRGTPSLVDYAKRIAEEKN